MELKILDLVLLITRNGINNSLLAGLILTKKIDNSTVLTPSDNNNKKN